MKSSHYTFSLPKLPRDNAIEKLSFDEFYDMGLGNVTLPSFPPKGLKEMVRLVNEGKSAEISIFEWLDVIEDQAQWDALTEDENLEACIASWRAIGTNHVLGDIALFKIALSVDGRSSSIVRNLTETIAIARKAKGLSDIDAMRMDWLLSLKQQDHQQLAAVCYQRQLTVAEYIKLLRLPQANSYASKVSSCLFACIQDGNLSEQDDSWLNRNFRALKTSGQQLDFCESFLLKFDQSSYGLLCEEIISTYCLPMKEDSFWNRLSLKAKQILKRKFKLSNYFDLRAISSALYSEEAAVVLGYSEDQTRQIRSRSMFWSNYSSKFERVRVLLPKKSFHFVMQLNKGLPPFVDDIDETGSLDTEIYIFELGKIIAVEFLRGPLSETRLFKNDAWYSQRLFESKSLSMSDIRGMAQLEVHDHGPYWLYFCEKLLRTKYNVTPNENIHYFRGLPPDVNEYKKGVGLTFAPTEDMMQERMAFLESWVERFWNIEQQTGKFGELRGLEQKSTLYLSKALMAKQLGNQEDYDFFIRKAANQGNPEAMWQLGRSMLLGRNSDVKWRKAGEEWISKAAESGHKEAVETARKYRIYFPSS